ncbi:MAG TPA: hypothetical protein VLH15_07055, partial [Dehalococcoidales bacterium]|nr:hypothetical protein [Dehalococcoidales bacterium]
MTGWGFRFIAPMSSKGASGLQDDSCIFEGMTVMAWILSVVVLLEASRGEAEASGGGRQMPLVID